MADGQQPSTRWWANMRDFLLSTQRTKAPEVHLMASTYVGTLVFILCLANQECKNVLKPLANVIFIVGIAETLHFADRVRMSRRLAITIPLGLLSHALVFWAAVDGRPRRISYAVALLVLLVILATYMLTDTWPYTSSPLTLTGLSLAILADQMCSYSVGAPIPSRPPTPRSSHPRTSTGASPPPTPASVRATRFATVSGGNPAAFA